jgi:hypothetical protein
VNTTKAGEERHERNWMVCEDGPDDNMQDAALYVVCIMYMHIHVCWCVCVCVCVCVCRTRGNRCS